MVTSQLFFFFFQIKFKLVQAPPRLGEQDCSIWHCWGLPTPFSLVLLQTKPGLHTPRVGYHDSHPGKIGTSAVATCGH